MKIFDKLGGNDTQKNNEKRGDEQSQNFDSYSDFVSENLPSPGKFLKGHRVLEGDKHIDFHRHTRNIFEKRGVYDMTFGYNLAKLNLDRRHPDAGFRYAEENDDVLRAEFTPTTRFCPQASTLALGSMRAWNDEDLKDLHSYEMVKVRVNEHDKDELINTRLEKTERPIL